MEKIEGIDVLHCKAGDSLSLDIDVCISKDVCIDLVEFRRALEDYSRHLILSYELHCCD